MNFLIEEWVNWVPRLNAPDAKRSLSMAMKIMVQNTIASKGKHRAEPIDANLARRKTP
jgi:hypothetical protein